jgi:archaellum component FlaF (FlaF/FlaG flagellin family)
MGFSTSAVVVIFTASIFYIASMFYPLYDMSNKQVHEAEKYSNELWKEKLNTKIVITNRAGNDLTIFNDGSTTLDSGKINVIIDGEFKSGSSYIVSPGDVWPPKTSINVDIVDAGGRVKIITANGAADYSVP